LFNLFFCFRWNYTRKYENNRKEKIKEFKEAFRELKNKLKLKNVEFHYIQSQKPEIWK
jgi:hypothetical protein